MISGDGTSPRALRATGGQGGAHRSGEGNAAGPPARPPPSVGWRVQVDQVDRDGAIGCERGAEVDAIDRDAETRHRAVAADGARREPPERVRQAAERRQRAADPTVMAQLVDRLVAAGLARAEAERVSLRRLVVFALTAPIGRSWGEHAVSWIEAGFPIDDEIASALEQVAQDKRYQQRMRHRAFAAAKRCAVQMAIHLECAALAAIGTFAASPGNQISGSSRGYSRLAGGSGVRTVHVPNSLYGWPTGFERDRAPVGSRTGARITSATFVG